MSIKFSKEHEWINAANPEAAIVGITVHAQDALGDVVSDTILYFPFVLLFPGAAIWILLILFISVLTEFIGVLAQTIGASRRYDGPAGKSDRAFLFGALGLWAAVFPAYLDSALFPVLFAVFTALLFLTCYHRIRRALQESAQQSASQKD